MEGEDPLSICYCGWGYNRPMIRCHHCKHWYHYDCVNVRLRDLNSLTKWYCFMCIEYKPDSDAEDEDYDFDKDLREHRLAEEYSLSPKRIRRIAPGFSTSYSSFESMSEKQIRELICLTEQKLLSTDTSKSIHDSEIKIKNNESSKHMIERAQRLSIIRLNKYQFPIFKDIELHHLYNTVLLVQKFTGMQPIGRKSVVPYTSSTQPWMTSAISQCKDDDIVKECIGITADVRTFNWNALSRLQFSLTQRKFDVVLMDPPWQLSGENPSRGVTITYQSLDDASISRLPLSMIQDSGLLFMWVINCKFAVALKMIKNWGYTFVDDICWLKLGLRNFLKRGNGFYLQHAKETCLVAVKGKNKFVDEEKLKTLNDVIYAKREGQSQKPNELYSLIEELVPNGYYVEIFGRWNNLRKNWVTIGNEI